jgi:hypothetical protein
VQGARHKSVQIGVTQSEYNAREFRRQIFDPADPVTIFEERLNQKNVWPMFSNQFAGVVKPCAPPRT